MDLGKDDVLGQAAGASVELGRTCRVMGKVKSFAGSNREGPPLEVTPVTAVCTQYTALSLGKTWVGFV